MTAPWAYVVSPPAAAAPPAAPAAAAAPAVPAPAAQVRAAPGVERLRVDKVPPNRVPAAPRVHPVRALVGASLAVAGVALGIGGLLLVVDRSQTSPQATALGVPGPSVQPPTTQDASAQGPVAPGPVGSQEPTASDAATRAPVTKRRPAAAPAAPPAPARPAPPALTVLNNSRLTGLAAEAAARYADGGWPIALVGNYNGRLRDSTVYYLPGQRAAALRLAREYGVPRVLPRPERLPGQGLTVVLTRLSA